MRLTPRLFNGYLRTAADYVHLNPVRAGLLQPEQKHKEFGWSSIGEYLREPKARSKWPRVDRVLGECGIPKDSPAGRREFERRTEARRAANAEEFEQFKGGWSVGDDEFREEPLAQMDQKRGAEHFGNEVREREEVKAGRLVKQELRKLSWPEKELTVRRKGDPEKLRLAQLLRRNTTMTVSWIAKRLHMGVPSHLTHLLYWAGKKKPKKKNAK